MKRSVFILLCLALALSAWAAPTKVVVYTAHEDSILNALAPRFEKETGIKLEYIKLGSGDIFKRVEAEAANPQADVIWSAGGEQMEADSAILAPYTPKEWSKIQPVFKVGTNWLPYTGIMNVFIVNTKMLTADKMPKKWTDLAEPRFAKLISSARADKSGSAYMQLCNTLLIYKDKGWDTYKGIMKNMVISASSGSVPKFVNDGEQAVGITLEDNAYRYVLGGGPVKIVYPTDGVVAAPDGIALIKGAPNPEAGKIFIDWCLSKPTQEYLVGAMFRRSVRIDCKDPEGLPALKDIVTIPYDFKWAATNKVDFMKKFVDLAMELGL
ncbi:MAG: ABC transporter substrate-binding protein [Spirochaetae bacterium HGW-Spirochaetae-7]|jgi:iron(III) transport system substrate-binding protein|nr:MAG: ABC transporter substrate-binding protein [Spirochaetae bacterium HGW-Spirochaetae-7]